MMLVNNNPHLASHSKKHAIPALLDINPYEEFEFSFPAQTMWWDDSSDFSTSDDEQHANLAAAQLAQYRPVEKTLSVMLQKPNPYQMHFESNATAIPDEEKGFIFKIILMYFLSSMLQHLWRYFSSYVIACIRRRSLKRHTSIL